MFRISYQYISFTQARARVLKKSLKAGSEISEPVGEIHLQKEERILALLCLNRPQEISHICWGRKGDKAGTALTKLNFDRVEEISPIDVKEILESWEWDKFVAFFNMKRIYRSSDDCSEVIQKLREEFPDVNTYIQQSIIDYTIIDELPSHSSAIVRQEHDATEMVIRVAGMTPRHAYQWSPSKQGRTQVSSFFSGLAPAKYEEDDIVRWDLDKIPGLDVLKKYVNGHFVLSDGKNTLHTFHANKNALEHTLGVDLIYFNEQHKSFTLVQYKMAKPQGKTHILRFPDEQLTEEIERMDMLGEILTDEEAKSSTSPAENYRIIHSPFFLKICPQDRFDPDANEQVKGMILPLDMWKEIEKDSTGRFEGPRGGSLLSFDNCPRHFDNTKFISLIQDGWIGTTTISREFLEAVVVEIINSKKSLIFASKIKMLPEDKKKTKTRRRRKKKSKG